MAFTPHGYHIPDTSEDKPTQPGFVPCGGLSNCKYCIQYAAIYKATVDSLKTNPNQKKAGIIWSATDATGSPDNHCEMYRTHAGWQLAVTEGPEYTTVNLSRDDMLRLRIATGDELI